MAFPQIHGWLRAFHILSYDGEPSDTWGEVRGSPGGIVQKEDEDDEKDECGDQLHCVVVPNKLCVNNIVLLLKLMYFVLIKDNMLNFSCTNFVLHILLNCDEHN